MARQIDGIRRMLLIINKIYATNGQYGDSCVSVHELLSSMWMLLSQKELCKETSMT